MKLGFFYSEENFASVRTISNLKELLKENDIEFCDLEESRCVWDSCPDIDLIVVFGGDGSVLRAAKIALDKIPIVAINTGNVGFLTSYEQDDLNELVEAIRYNTLNFITRRLMAVECAGETFYALNDATISKNFHNDTASECIKLSLKIDERLVDRYVSDGLVLSTATGSTAYALSCGGPIITPDLEAIIAAPICAHSLHSRPIVFSSSRVADVSVHADSKECLLYVDGAVAAKVKPGDGYRVYLSDKKIRICDNSGNFFEKLSKKITSWSING